MRVIEFLVLVVSWAGDTVFLLKFGLWVHGIQLAMDLNAHYRIKLYCGSEIVDRFSKRFFSSLCFSYILLKVILQFDI